MGEKNKDKKIKLILILPNFYHEKYLKMENATEWWVSEQKLK